MIYFILGIDLLWLYRMGILEREIESTKISSQQDEFFTYKYVLKEGADIG